MKRRQMFGSYFFGGNFLNTNEMSYLEHQVISKPSKSYRETNYHTPHNGKKEKARRVRQMESGVLNRP